MCGLLKVDLSRARSITIRKISNIFGFGKGKMTGCGTFCTFSTFVTLFCQGIPCAEEQENVCKILYICI